MFSSLIKSIHFTVFLAVSCCVGSGTYAAASNAMGTLHRRSYFYVGQFYFDQGNSSLIASGQMYVEHLAPENISQKLPLVFIPGFGMTGTNLLNTPDGRLGWVDYFLGKGYEFYIVDPPGRARSAWQQNVDSPQSIFDTTTVEARFTAAERYKLWPQASLHTRWPGNGTAGDPTFDEFYASIVPSVTSALDSSERVKAAGTNLLDKIGKPVILLSHSFSGQYGWILGDARPSLVQGIVALEPTGPPFIQAVFPPIVSARPYGLTETPLAYSPPLNSTSDLHPVAVATEPSVNYTCYLQASPVRKLVNLAEIPIVVVTSESSFHAVYDGCTVQYLQQAGVNVEHLILANVGIHGNGHMMFMELNGLDIARIVEQWVSRISRRL